MSKRVFTHNETLERSWRARYHCLRCRHRYHEFSPYQAGWSISGKCICIIPVNLILIFTSGQLSLSMSLETTSSTSLVFLCIWWGKPHMCHRQRPSARLPGTKKDLEILTWSSIISLRQILRWIFSNDWFCLRVRLVFFCLPHLACLIEASPWNNPWCNGPVCK